MPAEPQAEDLDTLARAAGDSVTEHVRALLRAANKRAEEIETEAQDRGRAQADAALDAARRVLARVEAIEAQLGDLVEQLRDEAGQLPGAEDGQPAPTQAPTPLGTIQHDVNQIAANLRAVMAGARQLPEPPAEQPSDTPPD